jgi:hypothetical protein
MIKIFSFVAILVVILGINSSCDLAASQNGLNENLPNKAIRIEQQNINSNIFVEDVNSLCNKLSELKRMPHKDPVADDYVYDGLMKKGKEAIPCLVDKITDRTKMDDPREAPHILDFTIGDTAVFMLHRITKEPLQSILPNEYAKHWETEGVYAYFAYVEKPQHRKTIQQWWKAKLKQLDLKQ